AVEMLVQSGLGLARQAYLDLRPGLLAQLPPSTVAPIRVTDQIHGGVRVTREAAQVVLTIERPPAQELPEGLLAAAGFNDTKGMFCDPVPGSPYPLDTSNAIGGLGEPGWAGPWPKHPAATFQTKVVFEGDGALYLKGAANVGPNYGRQLAQPQT